LSRWRRAYFFFIVCFNKYETEKDRGNGGKFKKIKGRTANHKKKSLRSGTPLLYLYLAFFFVLTSSFFFFIIHYRLPFAFHNSEAAADLICRQAAIACG
jgi:hypothetical protein